MGTRGKNIFTLLSTILERPTRRTVEHVRESVNILGLVNPEAKPYLEQFREFCLANPLSRLDELYTRTFDLKTACSPYVAHHLFGNERSRRLFLAKLKEYYSPRLAPRTERPDHIAVVLRSVIMQESVEEARELIVHCLIPALKKMIGSFRDKDNPYQGVLRAVLLALESADKIPKVA